MQLKLWSEGMDSTFITIIGPKKDAGITTLRVDTEMWNYFPKINKVMKVPPSMMMGPWIGILQTTISSKRARCSTTMMLGLQPAKSTLPWLTVRSLARWS